MDREKKIYFINEFVRKHGLDEVYDNDPIVRSSLQHFINSELFSLMDALVFIIKYYCNHNKELMDKLVNYSENVTNPSNITSEKLPEGVY